MNRKGLSLDAWIMALPDNLRNGICPCGCGKKMKKIPEADLQQHEDAFVESWLKRRHSDNEKETNAG